MIKQLPDSDPEVFVAIHPRSAKSPYKDRIPSAAACEWVIRQVRDTLEQWAVHPEQIPAELKRGLQAARRLNERAKAQARAQFLKQFERM